ncbi:hypothetical protein [Vulcanisaeta sp. JCM 16161]|uniref:hypothetical protein n=1 Tax=Vulcanisaeta sp. JCM 16161 TaxID=1295372 RepID=UPI0006CF25CF|nr:hypothetical protein [Vulcanisaeta sp. JCM 16161]
MVRLNEYTSYMLISIMWLILELVLTRYGQVSGMAFLGMLINVISMVIASYRPAYSKYLFVINTVLLTITGFLIPPTIIMPYTVALTIIIVLYLLLIGMLELYSLILSLLIIYLSYIIERMLMKLPAFSTLTLLIKGVGINTGLFMALFTWYLSLFIISVIIVLLIMLLSKKVLVPSNTY